jgi:putative oxidoreductase
MNFDALGAAWAPRLLSIVRIMSGLLFLQHGTAKLLAFPAGAVPPNFTLM